jgi:hypothetical protein
MDQMTDLTYYWVPIVGTLDDLMKRAEALGEVELGPSPRLPNQHQIRAVIRIGEYNDIEIRCVGFGSTANEALGQALARARWCASRLTDPPGE